MLSSLKKKIVALLLAVAFVLLLANVVAELLNGEEKPETPQVTAELIFDNIEQILDSYNIELKWRKRVYFKPSAKLGYKYVYRVRIPSDLLPPLLVKDILWNFKSKPLFERALAITVKKEKGKTVVRFRKGEQVVFRLDLFWDKKLKRQHSEIALIVRFGNDADEEEVKKILLSRYKLTFLFPPDGRWLAIKNKILSVGKDFAILYNDEVSDDNYLVEADYSRLQISNVVANIVRDFKDAVRFFYDPNSHLARSPIFYFVSASFSKRGKKLFPLNQLNYLHGESEREIISRFKFFEESGLNKGRRRLVVNAEDFPALEKYLPSYFKKGNVLVSYK